MTLFSRLRPLLVASYALGLIGCFPVSDSPADEEKDPHYLEGKSRWSSMDYDGAIAAFESALASNPKSAAAHLQLGFLCEEKKNDYAAAIYHFQKHLELRPQSNMAETIKQHVFSCELELARKVPFALVSGQVQEEMRKLYTTNAMLHDHVQQLIGQLQEQAIAFSNKLAMAAAQLAAQRDSQPPERAEPERRPPVSERVSAPVSAHVPVRATAIPRSHVVRSGETLVSIARKYNLRLSALQNANPAVEARRIKVGQVLNLPTSRN